MDDDEEDNNADKCSGDDKDIDSDELESAQLRMIDCNIFNEFDFF